MDLNVQSRPRQIFTTSYQQMVEACQRSAISLSGRGVMTLVDRIAAVNSTNPYFAKDLAKARMANKFIGRGSLLSSTHKYSLAAGELANGGFYCSDDVVFISVEGARRGRISLDEDEVLRALNAKATIVADSSADRNRPYNVGERELVALLLANRYIESSGGVWKSSP